MVLSDKSRIILVADDDQDIRLIVSTAIGVLGCKAVEASDGTAAVEVVETQAIDLAVLDIGMPGMNGLEVCQRIKSREDGELIPVIMLTARDAIRDKVEALESGADDYLTKPFHLHELQARIKALLRVRDLNIRLREKNEELHATQERLIEKERQLLVGQLAGTAAHSLGQPLAAIMLNTHLLESLPPDDPRYQKALHAVKMDAKRMAELIEKLRNVDASNREEYFGKTDILGIKPRGTGD